MILRAGDEVAAEVVLSSQSGKSMFEADAALTANNLDDYKPPAGRGMETARVLRELGFTVRHIGTFSISVEATRSLWEKTFNTKVEKRAQPISTAHPEIGSVEYWSHIADTKFDIPRTLQNLVERAYPQFPPIFFESSLPPRVDYHHLEVPADVAMVLRADGVHQHGVTGRGVLVAMADTGFYRHPFYAWHSYHYHATLAPDATNVDQDAFGHGTAEAANIFSCAPDIDFIGVKVGLNSTLAFKTASDLEPAVMTNSWGYDLPGLTTLPNFLRPLEAAVLEAVNLRGIIVCFSGGNKIPGGNRGAIAFPAMMPDVLAVGGVHARANLVGDDFYLEASDYASSFDSLIYPGRHVPDVCGLVGMQPGALYIMLPVPPGSAIDVGVSGGAHPNGDETASNDGWAAISGTSAASPQIAGVCALLKQVQPGLSPKLAKAVLRASARDVTVGASSNGQPAGPGHDGATGAGLVNATAAYELARSVQTRQLFTLPPPR
jgi:subtilisin family serine protease